MKDELLKNDCLTLKRFAHLLNYPTAQNKEFNTILKYLVKRGWVEIQQSGFRGHNLEHHKLIAVREPLEIDHFKRIIEKLKVNFQIGEYTIHQTTKLRRCGRCKNKIYPSERYGVRLFLRGRRHGGGVRKMRIVCFLCLVNDYEEFYDVK
jgi:hypothetical protein